jgi:LmbE family N-acetylglucosaminyl deacetylase
VTETIVGIVAHPDDEIAMVGTLKNHADRGDSVTLAWMTAGENTTMLKGSPEEKAAIRRDQADAVSALLGVKTHFLGFSDSQVPYTMEAAHRVADFFRETKPSVVITWNDYWQMGAGHPDHRNTCYLVRDALTYSRFPDQLPAHRDFVSLYLYYNLRSSLPVVYVDVSDQKGIFEQVVDIYASVYGEWPVVDWKYKTMKYLGIQAGCELAEAFNVVQNRSAVGQYLE